MGKTDRVPAAIVRGLRSPATAPAPTWSCRPSKTCSAEPDLQRRIPRSRDAASAMAYPCGRAADTGAAVAVERCAPPDPGSRRRSRRARTRSSSRTGAWPGSSTTCSPSRAPRRCSSGSRTRSASSSRTTTCTSTRRTRSAASCCPCSRGGTWAEEVLANAIPYGQGITGWAVVHREPGARQRGAPRPPRRVRARNAGRSGGPDHRSADRARRAQGRAEHLPHRARTRSSTRTSSSSPAGSATRLRSRSTTRRSARASSTSRTPTRSPASTTTAYFHERLRAELQRAGRAHDSVALMMLDIDDFKRVNDVCGHGEGDQVLEHARRRPALDRARRRHRLPRRRRGVRGHPPVLRRRTTRSVSRARLREALAADPGRVHRRDHDLGRHRARPRARDERARADRLRRVGDDDGEGPREGPHRRLRGRGRGAARTTRPARATSARSPT